MKQRFHILRLAAVNDAHADRERRQAVFGIFQFPVDLRHFRIDQLLLHGVGVHHKYGKFIAADPADIIVGTEAALQYLHQLLQRLVANIVPVGVVNTLEVIYVEKQQIGGIHVKAGKQQVKAGPVVGPRQFVVGCLKV